MLEHKTRVRNARLCGSPMRLRAIEPSGLSQDLRTFACPRCNRIQRHIMQSSGTVSGLRMTQLAVTTGPELLSAGRHQKRT